MSVWLVCYLNPLDVHSTLVSIYLMISLLKNDLEDWSSMEGNLTIEDEGIRGILEIPSSLTDLDSLNASNHP